MKSLNQKQNRVKIRPITRKDIETFNDGQLYPVSLKGLAVECDGETLGIAGVLHSQPPAVFSTMTDEMRKYPVTIMKTAKRLLKIMKTYSQPLYAVADDDEKDADSFLQHLGFVFVHENDDGRFYVWDL